MGDYEVLPFPRERDIVVDAGHLGSRRHIIHGLLEADVTKARELRRLVQARYDVTLSFTAFVVCSLARAVASRPEVQAYRDWRGRLIVFRDADVVTMIEPAPGGVALPHIIRNVNSRTVRDISDEIRSIQANPQGTEQHRSLLALGSRVPRSCRLLFFWAVKKNPHWFRRLQGTIVVTSVGMFGKSGGWGVGFLPTHTLGLTVGGIARKPGVHKDRISLREYLHLTISFDHDVVDGAPAARFARVFVDLLEMATVLEEAMCWDIPGDQSGPSRPGPE